jgi:hypothetical protein
MIEQELLHKVSPILRARDFRLYTQGGTRLVDLWQYGGAAILGHTPPQVLRELKNSAERGLFSPFPHPMEARFIKALARLFPDGKAFRVYADEARLRAALTQAGLTVPEVFPDPAFLPETFDDQAISLWRPFIPQAPGPRPHYLIPVLPWVLSPKVLVIGEAEDSSRSLSGFSPDSDLVSPAILAAATRAVYDLLAALEKDGRGTPAFPKVEQALGQKNGVWRCSGIYLTYTGPLDGYTALFLRFLEGGFLLPPSPGQPLILPGAMSPGEEAKLAVLLQTALS